MGTKRFNKQFERIKYYEDIHHNVDVAKIANLAYEEMIKSFIEIVTLDGGLDFIKSKLKSEENSRLVRKLLGFILAFDRKFAIEFYASKVKQNDKEFVFIEPYGSEDFKSDDAYQRMKKAMNRNARKMKKKEIFPS